VAPIIKKEGEGIKKEGEGMKKEEGGIYHEEDEGPLKMMHLVQRFKKLGPFL